MKHIHNGFDEGFGEVFVVFKNTGVTNALVLDTMASSTVLSCHTEYVRLSLNRHIDDTGILTGLSDAWGGGVFGRPAVKLNADNTTATTAQRARRPRPPGKRDETLPGAPPVV